MIKTNENSEVNLIITEYKNTTITNGKIHADTRKKIEDLTLFERLNIRTNESCASQQEFQ